MLRSRGGDAQVRVQVVMKIINWQGGSMAHWKLQMNEMFIHILSCDLTGIFGSQKTGRGCDISAIEIIFLITNRGSNDSTGFNSIVKL